MHDRDTLGLSSLVLSYTLASLLIPEVTTALLVEPTFSGAMGAAALVSLIVVLRGSGRRGSRVERRCLAAFLALMPSVYLTSWARHGHDLRWLGVEVGGQLAFAALAVAGARRSPWFLALGIAAHGVLWDSWHYGRAPFIANWYVIACVVVDLGFGLYVATQVRAFQEANAGAS